MLILVDITLLAVADWLHMFLGQQSNIWVRVVALILCPDGPFQCRWHLYAWLSVPVCPDYQMMSLIISMAFM